MTPMPDADLIEALVIALAKERGEPEAVVRTRFGIEPP